ncbi:MAG: cytochrome c4 [Betaproteobacteria bacterium]|nr:cytochrome c4 [Betaproteobacteria bacterium]
MIRALALFASAALMAAAGSAFAVDTTAKKAANTADPAKGQVIANQVCAACHAADGNSVAPANPNLAGQFQEYLHKQLVNFKPQGANKAERVDPVMAGMVANLSPEDMKNLAAYYAGQKLKPSSAKDRNLVVAGQRLWRGGNAATGVPACAGCHGPDGLGIPAQYPRIAGQYAEYIEAQLKLFQTDKRANDLNGMMRGVAARMNEREMKAVAEYAAGLR